ncbi:hypothetical protein SCLCIDRAFT_34587 [Scleroderma citrinum Foug A]|uniref:Uncharacterized protein n=1 Tax=Scleroderma citrinum Foug A TaxID=1036808 RepID=A0A0C2ZAQ5_9AGAM|nr:hypothetical protein SCLCIDRAFT_34587 [Scleroderma citrinum Foug A]
MSAPSKSNTPTPATANQSKGWTKAATPELNARTDDETKVVMAKQGEQKQHKQARNIQASPTQIYIDEDDL